MQEYSPIPEDQQILNLINTDNNSDLTLVDVEFGPNAGRPPTDPRQMMVMSNEEGRYVGDVEVQYEAIPLNVVLADIHDLPVPSGTPLTINLIIAAINIEYGLTLDPTHLSLMMDPEINPEIGGSGMISAKISSKAYTGMGSFSYVFARQHLDTRLTQHLLNGFGYHALEEPMERIVNTDLMELAGLCSWSEKCRSYTLMMAAQSDPAPLQYPVQISEGTFFSSYTAVLGPNKDSGLGFSLSLNSDMTVDQFFEKYRMYLTFDQGSGQELGRIDLRRYGETTIMLDQDVVYYPLPGAVRQHGESLTVDLTVQFHSNFVRPDDGPPTWIDYLRSIGMTGSGPEASGAMFFTLHLEALSRHVAKGTSIRQPIYVTEAQ